MQQLWWSVAVVAILWWIAGEDWLDRRISAASLALLAAVEISGGVAGVAVTEDASGLWNGTWAVTEESLRRGGDPRFLLLAFVPGVIMLMLSFLSEESLGRGDAYLFLAMGFGLRPIDVFATCQMSLLMGGIGGLFIECIGRKKERGKVELPLAPLAAVSAGILRVLEAC